jgi:hypothetical protein
MAWYDTLFDLGSKAVDYVVDNPGVVAGVVGNVAGAVGANNAGKDAAAASAEAGRQAAAAAEFRPYSITSGFGTGFFDTSRNQAGYQIDPTLQAFRDQAYGGASDFLGQVNTNPASAAQNYYDQQQSLMSGGRQAEDIALRNQQMQQGRIGLGLSSQAMGAGGPAGMGGGYVNPEQYQQQVARNMADQQLAGQSMQLAQADIDRNISRGSGMLQTATGLEQLGMSPLQMGADIGSRQAISGANQGKALLAGGQGAADANLAGGLGLSGMFSNAGNALMNYQQPQQQSQPSNMYSLSGGGGAGQSTPFGGGFSMGGSNMGLTAPRNGMANAPLQGSYDQYLAGRGALQMDVPLTREQFNTSGMGLSTQNSGMGLRF